MILLLAPLFSTIWIWLAKRDADPSTPTKFVLALLFIAFGFVLMVLASVVSAKYGKVSALWLIAFYLSDTLGELCLSPVGLSMVTKLSPAKFVSLLMGVWFLGNFVANYVGGELAGHYDAMSHSTFFMYPVAVAGGSALVLILLVKPLKKLMGGIQ